MITDVKAASMGTIVAASAIGTTIERYDFLIYATAASLVLNKLFFSPPMTPWWGSSYRSAPSTSVFFARPIDAIFLEPLRGSARAKVHAHPNAGKYGCCDDADWPAADL
jgi:hypothetical protein